MFSRIDRILKQEGYTPLNIVDENGCKIDFSNENFVLRKKHQIRIQCNECGNEYTKRNERFGTVTKHFEDGKISSLGFCKNAKHCPKYSKPKPRAPRTKLTFENCVHFFKEKGYTILSSENEFKNAMTMLSCIHDDTGEECRKSYNKLQQGYIGTTNSFAKTKMKQTDDRIRKEFEDQGIPLISLERGPLIDKTRKRKIFCEMKCLGCDEIVVQEYQNFQAFLRKKKKGIKSSKGCDIYMCKNCNRRVSWKKIVKSVDELGCQLLSPRSDYVNRMSKLRILCECGEEFLKSWAQICSSVKNTEAGPSSRKSNIYISCEDCSYRFKSQTLMEKYGAETYFKTQAFRDQYKAYLEANGVSHNSEIPEVVQKRKETCMENYGYTTNLLQPHMRDLAVEGLIEKYGQEYFFHSDEYNELMMKKYGVLHRLQDPEEYEKHMNLRFKYKQYEFSDGNRISVQGYEHFCLSDLENSGIQFDDITCSPGDVPEIWYEYQDVQRRYYTDIYLPIYNISIEVKSLFTLKSELELNRIKWIAACKTSLFFVCIYNKKGVCITCFMIDENENVEFYIGDKYSFSDMIGDDISLEWEDMLGI